MPSGSARVPSTASVCGRQSASARKIELAGFPPAPPALPAPPGPERPPGQGHRLDRGRRLVQHGRAGHRQRGQVLDHGLEVEQRLQPALRDLRLVGRVGGVPGRILQHVAADHGRGDGAVVAQADHRGEQLVPARETAQLGERISLAQRPGQAEGAVGSQPGGHGSRGELVERAVADGGQHPILLGC
jgi:hypothetical protein